MKKLLSLLAVSTLVGTSTSNLKPLFINNFVNTGFKSNQVNNKNISIRGNNDNPFINPIINAPKNILSLSITSDGTIWVGTDNGLYKSFDGETFNKVMKNFNVNTILTKNNGTIWASSNIGLYKSTDGKTLTPIKLIGTTPKTNLEISLNGSIYVSVNGAGWDNSGLYKSVDGENFNKISSLSGKEWLQNNKNINAVKSSNNGTIYVGTETGLYKSTDGILFNEIASMKVQCITNGSDGIIWVGTSDGLYHSIDGTIFNKIANIKVLFIWLRTNLMEQYM